MRTITEFFGMSLKAAAEKLPALTAEATKAAEEAMRAEGKTDEEVTAGLPEAAKAAVDAKIGETFKLEGDKLAMFAAALTVHKDARGNVKRVIVMVPASETEKAPSAAKEIDGKFYMVETFPDAARAPARDERDARGGKFGDKRGAKGGRGGKAGGRDGAPGGRGKPGEGRGPGRGESRPEGIRSEGARPESRAPRADAGAPGFMAVGGEAPGGRRPRTPRAPVEPYQGPNRIGVKAPGSAGESAPKAGESAPTDTSSAAT